MDVDMSDLKSEFVQRIYREKSARIWTWNLSGINFRKWPTPNYHEFKNILNDVMNAFKWISTDKKV